jgi:hypothetical protein
MGFISNIFGGKSKFHADTPGVDDGFYNRIQGSFDSNPELLGRRQALMNQLTDQSKGVGMTASDYAFRNATNNNLSNQMAMANSARMGNAGLAARDAMGNASLFNQNAAGQLMQQKSLESQQARGQLGQMIGEGIGQNDAMLQNTQNNFTQTQNTNAGTANANAGRNMGVASGILGGVGDALGLSDERQKKNIKDGDKNISQFLDALKAHSYNYKDSAFGQGEQTSVMAQDLEKTPVGKQMVQETPAGKAVDYGKGFAAILAAQAQLNERLKKIEEKKGGKKNG